MIRIMVCENDPAAIADIRSRLQAFAGPLPQELHVIWIQGDQIQKHAEEYAVQAHMAIVSMRLENGCAIARSIHRANSLCRLILHSGEPQELEPWIPAGPVAFCGRMDQLECTLQRLTDEIETDANVFTFTAQREKHFVPYKDIVFFQSALRYAEVHAYGTSLGRFLSKLDELEKQVPDLQFLRIHQSYLVNCRFITGIDAATHELILARDLRLPISAKYYSAVCERIDAVFGK